MDYCTAWPDGWPIWLGGTGTEWAHCCRAHDEFYASYDNWWRAFAVCDGDARATVKALLIANAFLEDELAMAVPAVSYGYSKGWHARKRDNT